MNSLYWRKKILKKCKCEDSIKSEIHSYPDPRGSLLGVSLGNENYDHHSLGKWGMRRTSGVTQKQCLLWYFFFLFAFLASSCLVDDFRLGAEIKIKNLI